MTTCHFSPHGLDSWGKLWLFWCFSTLFTWGKNIERTSILNAFQRHYTCWRAALLPFCHMERHAASLPRPSWGKWGRKLRDYVCFNTANSSPTREEPRTSWPAMFASLFFWTVLESAWRSFCSLLLVGWLALALVRKRTEKSSGKVQDVTENWTGESGVGWSPLCQKCKSSRRLWAGNGTAESEERSLPHESGPRQTHLGAQTRRKPQRRLQRGSWKRGLVSL